MKLHYDFVFQKLHHFIFAVTLTNLQ